MASQAAPAPFNPPTHILNADGLGPFLRLQRNLECREIPMMRCRSTSDQLLTPIVQEAVGWMNNLETAFQASFTAASRPTRVGELKRKTNALFGNRIQPNEWVVGIPRTIAGSAGAVTVAERVVPRQRVGYALQLPPGDAVDEVWVARRSVHEDRVAPWTACWADFERSFRGLQHLLTEYSITKSLKAFNRVVSWDNTPHLEVQTHGATYRDFSVAVYEVRHEHALTTPLVFSILQITFMRQVANGSGDGELTVVSLPISDLHLLQEAVITREPQTRRASYVAVERFRRVLDGNDARIEWLMATATDPNFSRGSSAMKNVADVTLPSIICEDVSGFFSWLKRRRAEELLMGVQSVQNDFARELSRADKQAMTEQNPAPGGGTQGGEAQEEED